MTRQSAKEAAARANEHYLKGQSWAVGDRVIVYLPDKSRRYAPLTTVFGTVEEVDSLSTPGVFVRLDWQVNGVDTCYATHGELRRDHSGLPARSWNQ